MLIAPPTAREQERIALLHALRLLDSPPEEAFDRITRLIARVLDVPIAVVSLVDTDRQWFKSRVGLDASETSRDVAFCAHTILDDEPMVITDALKDPRFFDNPLVTGFPNIRFYAGASILSSTGLALGTLCLIDTKPRLLNAEDVQVLKDFADLVRREVMSREALTFSSDLAQRSDAERERTETALRLLTADLENQVAARARQFHAVLESAPDAYLGIDHNGRIDDWNSQAERTFGWPAAEALGRGPLELLIPKEHWVRLQGMLKSPNGSILSQRAEIIARCRDGNEIPIEISLRELPSANGRRFSAFLRDISERKQVDAALRRSREQMRAIADHVPLMIAHVDKNLRHTFANAAFRTMRRIEPGTILGRTVRDVVGEKAYPEFEGRLALALRGERSMFELSDDLGHFWQVRIEPDIKDGEGQGAYIVTVDISSVKQAELILKNAASLDS